MRLEFDPEDGLPHDLEDGASEDAAAWCVSVNRVGPDNYHVQLNFMGSTKYSPAKSVKAVKLRAEVVKALEECKYLNNVTRENTCLARRCEAEFPEVLWHFPSSF